MQGIRIVMLATGLGAVMALGACGDDDETATEGAADTDAATDAQATGKVGAPGAEVSFVTPKEGDAVSGAVKARVKLTGFYLVPDNVGKPAKEGEGHLHFSLDGGKYDEPKYSGANGELAVKLGVNGKYSPSTTPTITYKGLPPGEHTLEVYLANNDHSDTGVEGETKFTVEEGDESAGRPVKVAAVDLAFEPSRTTVEVGQTVTWTNTGQTTHNVKGQGFFSRVMEPGKRYSYTPRKAGTFPYVCTFHPQQMRGTLTVE